VSECVNPAFGYNMEGKSAKRDANTARPPQSPIDAQSPRGL